MNDKEPQTTMEKDELDMIRLSKRKSVSGILEALCDFYYIYGKDRSHFMADWTSSMRHCIIQDSYYFDKPAPVYVLRGFNEDPLHGHYFFIRGALRKIFNDIQEHGAYAINDKEKLTEKCCELFKAAWELKEKNNFKNTLAGKRNVIYW